MPGSQKVHLKGMYNGYCQDDDSEKVDYNVTIETAKAVEVLMYHYPFAKIIKSSHGSIMEHLYFPHDTGFIPAGTTLTVEHPETKKVSDIVITEDLLVLARNNPVSRYKGFIDTRRYWEHNRKTLLAAIAAHEAECATRVVEAKGTLDIAKSLSSGDVKATAAALAATAVELAAMSGSWIYLGTDSTVAAAPSPKATAKPLPPIADPDLDPEDEAEYEFVPLVNK